MREETMTTAFKLAKAIRFLCDLSLGGGICGLAFYSIWLIWLLFSPVIMGGSRHMVGGVVSMAVGEAGPPQSPPVSPAIIGGPDLLAGESAFLQSLPVTVVSNDNGLLVSPKFSGTIGEMLFQTRNWRIHILLFLGLIIPLILYMGILYLIRQFLVDAMQGIPFAFDNAQRLKWIGWLLLGIGVVKPFLNYLTGHWILSAVTVQGPMLSPWVNLGFVGMCVIVACFSLILSVIFRYGVELEKERSLTV
jgi:hypothetical protein